MPPDQLSLSPRYIAPLALLWPLLSMLRGILLKIASVFVFTVMSALVKHAARSFPVGEVVFARSFFALPVILGWLAWQGKFPAGLSTARLGGHVLRGVVSAGGMIFGFWGLSLLPLPDATAIGFAVPLIVVALAALVLHERVRVYRWSAVAVGFAGVLIMLWEHLGDAAPGAAQASPFGDMVALTAAVFAALATIQTRRLTRTEGTGAIVFYLSLMTTLFGAASLFLPALAPILSPRLAAQAWAAPGWRETALLGLIGLLGGLGQLLLTGAARLTDASVIAPLDYMSLIWALAFGALFFDERASALVLAGAVLVIGAGIFVIWREHRLGLLRREVVVTERL